VLALVRFDRFCNLGSLARFRCGWGGRLMGLEGASAEVGALAEIGGAEKRRANRRWPSYLSQDGLRLGDQLSGSRNRRDLTGRA